MLKKMLLLIVVLMISSCTTRLEKLRTTLSQPVGNNFQVSLAHEYLNFAESEADQYDWYDSSYFAKKGLDAAHGMIVQPEYLEDWDLPQDEMPVLVQARQYLENTFNAGVVEKHPEKAARAQFLFDCWVEQQEENWQEDDIAACREEFYKTLDELYSYTTSDNTQPDEQQGMLGVSDTKNVYFKLGSAKIDSKAMGVISNVVADVKDLKQYNITLNGYADRVGAADYNMKLSKKRAMSVKDAMVKAGANKDKITIFAFGEADNKVPTEDNVANPLNRLVEVVVEK